MAKERIKYLSKRLEVDEYIYPKASGSRKKKEKPKTADQLSKGNQQKIQFLVALLSDPDILILDEPLSGLDPVNADLFKSIIREEMDQGKYMIMSSHQMATIEEFCEDITILNKGKVVLQGNLNKIKKEYGRVKLFVKCDEDISDILDEMEIHAEEKTAEGYYIKVKEEKEEMCIRDRFKYNADNKLCNPCCCHFIKISDYQFNWVHGNA